MEKFGLEEGTRVWLLGSRGDVEEFAETHYTHHRNLGHVLWVFTSPAEAEKFVRLRVEGAGESLTDFPNLSEALHRGGRIDTVFPVRAEGLARAIDALDIDVVSIDAGSGNPTSRMYRV